MRSLVAVLAIPFLIAACGYHLAKRSPVIPEWMKNVYVEPFENNSNDLLLGQWITQAIRDEFLRGSSFNLTSKDKADIIIRGKVEEVQSEGLSYVRYDRTVERSVTVKVSFDLVDASSGQSIWGGGEIEREEAFFVGNSAIKTQGYKEEALRKLSLDLAEILYHRLVGVY